MDENAGRLAEQVAFALIPLIPTADMSEDVADEVARILGHADEDEIRAIADLLRETAARLEHASADQQGVVRSAALAVWTDRITALLTEDRVSAEEVRALAALLRRASQGVSGRSDRGPTRDGSPAARASDDRRRSLRGLPEGFDFDRHSRRNRPPGPPVGEPDDDE